MTTNKILFFTIIIIVLQTISLYIVSENNDKIIEKIDIKNKIIDSLESQIYSYELMMMEYELMYNNIDSVYKKRIDSLLLQTE